MSGSYTHDPYGEVQVKCDVCNGRHPIRDCPLHQCKVFEWRRCEQPWMLYRTGYFMHMSNKKQYANRLYVKATLSTSSLATSTFLSRTATRKSTAPSNFHPSARRS